MIIHWFRRDLRLHDNSALMAAARDSGGAVLPAFILDDSILGGRWASPARAAFLLDGLRALDADLRARGLRLIVRRGDPRRELLQLAEEAGARGVYWNRDYSPYAIRRDSAIKAALGAAGYAARSFKDVVIFEMGEVVTKGGGPYSVYTPYARQWRQLLGERGAPAQGAPELVALDAVPEGGRIPELAELGMACAQEIPVAGEARAGELLRQFSAARRDSGIAGYAERRNMPGVEGTSRLSPHLRLGMVSPRQCVAAALGSPPGPGPDTWLGELAWRDFYVQVMYHSPHVLRGAFRPAYDGLKWENDERLFAAWREGRTGYPIIDAAMRQLRQEGWMHNRARMIVASFLTKDLLIDWRWGERHFMRLLMGGDPAANNGGWQWAAGTGTDAQPYFRIFNPASQGEKFDPDGAYVRRHVPELANVPSRHIHAPHLMAPAEQARADIQVGRDYPAPVVEHKERRERALAMYKAVRGG
ncbi:DNA photolyase family protein [Oscillochloris sp. ZM17-4]|uniref:cryptochrome/photolyase family protein n=1 Tax=Oscillochloris sp. ZM17-4 TaxID=2866714 RepID=UPI001C73BCBD|nr:deoxyribodipyrimidine photo-lyase [Oscillochloris sp. ZM17-4]MBX0326597.1 DNA photolyase family protein [Oscillochloris sp. ZM17-4]